MASKKDLVEAHAFNRRRLVSAFLSGAPGGREVEPVRYGRTLVGGLVLAVLIVVGAAVAPLLRPSIPDDWYADDGIVVGKSSGARFLALDGNLHPLLNIASGRLLLQGEDEVRSIPDDLIAERPIAFTVGIVGGPEFLPEPTALTNSGWSACTGVDQGITVRIARRPGAAALTAQALLVQTGADDERVERVIVDGLQFPLPSDERTRDGVLRALQLAGDEPLEVPAPWLDLMRTGDPLTPFSVPGAGDPAQQSVGDLDTVGMAILVEDVPYILTEGGLEQVSAFAYELYTSTGTGALLSSSLGDSAFTSAEIADLQNSSEDVLDVPTSWPTAASSPFDRSIEPCLLMTTAPKTAPTISLGEPVVDEARAVGSTYTQIVQPGSGAVVRADDGATIGNGLVYLIDSTGTAYAVGSPGFTESPLPSLGYDVDDDVAPVYAPWVRLFNEGPDLTSADAGTPAGS